MAEIHLFIKDIISAMWGDQKDNSTRITFFDSPDLQFIVDVEHNFEGIHWCYRPMVFTHLQRFLVLVIIEIKSFVW